MSRPSSPPRPVARRPSGPRSPRVQSTRQSAAAAARIAILAQSRAARLESRSTACGQDEQLTRQYSVRPTVPRNPPSGPSTSARQQSKKPVVDEEEMSDDPRIQKYAQHSRNVMSANPAFYNKPLFRAFPSPTTNLSDIQRNLNEFDEHDIGAAGPSGRTFRTRVMDWVHVTARASIARHRPPPGAYRVWSPSGNSFFWTTDEAQRVGGQLQAQEEAARARARGRGSGSGSGSANSNSNSDSPASSRDSSQASVRTAYRVGVGEQVPESAFRRSSCSYSDSQDSEQEQEADVQGKSASASAEEEGAAPPQLQLQLPTRGRPLPPPPAPPPPPPPTADFV
ncbi:hypothetical protein AC579_1222 [Pseudocercospora musae]|uniref:Uncharacterized protein n=1 Tax=Pseudocercospora musae TaxID=113226 RepID=A0A139I5I8_9PEZI|nr:hypothetical protein AC579_1222 [Pseudocercospora musae]KXT10024.1 hypothetical protein AC579_1222 [Pseudocercospora musae]